MPKRKLKEFRSDEVNDSSLSDRGVRAQRERLENLLEHGKKTLFRALKIARGIERQKLGRRQKTAKESDAPPSEAMRLNVEIGALKGLDLSVIAELRLYKSLSKSKLIVSAPAFPSYIQVKADVAAQSQDVAKANVQARLFNSTVVKSALTDAMNGITTVLGIESEEPVKKKKRLRAADYIVEKNTNETPYIEPRERPQQYTESKPEGLQHEDMASNDDDSIEYSIYHSRLAASSDNGSSQDEQSQNSSPFLQTPKQTLSRQRSPSRSPFPSLSRSSFPHPPKTTTFLPSLTLGGYISDSASSISATSPPPKDSKPRKNRRGQQERRQIWEKKFGANANHLKAPPATDRDRDRDQGWDGRKGASEERSTQRRGRGRGRDMGKGRGRGRGGEHSLIRGGRGGSRGGLSHNQTQAKKRGLGPHSSGANSDPVLPSRRPDPDPATGAPPLHPSWEAARRAKEGQKNVAFCGRKVVF